jgi:hypothetical protein
MGSATVSKRGTKLTPELQEQLTAYFPLIKKMAFEARSKYRKIMPDFSIDDWTSHLTEAACRIAPCWNPDKGVFGTLIKVGLSNIIKNTIRDYVKPERARIRSRQEKEDELSRLPGKFQDIPGYLDSSDQINQARSLLSEIRDDIKKATRRSDRLAVVEDFFESCDPGWLRGRPSKAIAVLLECSVAVIRKARGQHGINEEEETPRVSLAGADPVETSPAPSMVTKTIPEAPQTISPTPLPPVPTRCRYGLQVRRSVWLKASIFPR